MLYGHLLKFPKVLYRYNIMKIQKYYMEDWLNSSRGIHYNLSSSGCPDFYLGDFLKYCNTDISTLNTMFLGDNETRGSLRLRREICKSYEHVNIDEVMVANGTSEALFVFFNELLNKGDRVVVPFPAFQCLYQIPKSIGCSVAFLPLLENKLWQLDIDRLDKLVTKDTKLIIINTPHNPLGWTLSEADLIEIARIANKNDAYLLFDEHYRYLPLRDISNLIPSGYDVCKQYHDKVFATGSMIKCFGIVGIRIGWLIGDEQFILKCTDYKDYLSHTIPSITDYIAILALENKERIRDMNIMKIKKNLSLVNQFMKKNDEIFEFMEPTGGVVCFPRLKRGLLSEPFCRALFDQYRISLLPGFAFEVEDHFRMSLGLDTHLFSQALELTQEYICNMNK
jgi:aspartate/methionine/tyrosine aminotransferase